MTKTVYGVVHGKTIELEENPGVAEGQEVEITIKPVPKPRPWGKGSFVARGPWPAIGPRRTTASSKRFTRIGRETRAGEVRGSSGPVAPPGDFREPG